MLSVVLIATDYVSFFNNQTTFDLFLSFFLIPFVQPLNFTSPLFNHFSQTLIFPQFQSIATSRFQATLQALSTPSFNS
ncbi:hypothetical protein QVD17_25873 [Tagetes erecta]|uniref:Uncharacterized protein n=1 Tax=Tagetes erecta TaxID=13708 RepID=A0AAD8K9U8_TARER|nr:hypothetical protein QVD17_25873 [Tagetes erecta]